MTPLVIWFFYINLAAVMVSLLAWLAEWVLLAYDRQVRWAWLLCILASVTLPLVAVLWGEQIVVVEGLSSVDDAVAETLLSVTGNEVIYTSAGEYRLTSDVGRLIQLIWAGATGVTVLWLLWSAGRLRAARSGWERATGEAQPYYVTSSLGPGVMGVLDQQILLPRWVLELDEEDRELIWLHESEHVRASDNRVLAVGLGLLVVFPWILPLWWQFRRLRVAVELDCDRRVVSRCRNWKGYGRLLIRVAEGSTLQPATPFASRRNPLRKRIRHLRPDHPKRRGLRSAGAGLLMPVLVLGGLALPVPSEPDNWTLNPLPFEALRGTLDPPRSGYDEHQELLNREEYERAVAELYPDELREQGTEGEVVLFLHVSDEGRVDVVRLDQPNRHDAFNRAAVSAARVRRYRPARKDGAPVGAWVFLTVRFELPD